MPKSHWTARLDQALPYIIVLLALVARLLPGARTIDDAYITFRYARNLVAGEGLVYNPGERVLGTTTPLYAGLLAGIAFFTGGVDAPFSEIARWINAFADAVVCLLLLRMGRKLTVSLAGVGAALAWAVLPFSVTFAIGGLETSVFVLLLTGLAAAYLEGRYTSAALLAALSLLTRPDAALLVAPFILDRTILAMRKNGRAKISPVEISVFAIPLLLWLIPASLYYGNPIPHSLTAKAAAYSLPADGAFTRLVQHYATPFMDNLTFGSFGIMAGVFIYPFLSILGGWRLQKAHPRALSWLAFPWLWFAAYAIANPLIFRWYLTPPLPPYIFSILAGLSFIRKDFKSKTFRPGIAGLIVLAPLALALRGWTASPDHGPTKPAPEMAYIELELKYIEAAEYLLPILKEMPADTVVAAADIGAIGYFTNARILDTLGLVSPESTNYYPTRPEYYVNAYAVSPELILDLQPEFIVLLEVYGREGLFKNAAFLRDYELVYTVETGIYDSTGMPIYIRGGGNEVWTGLK